MNFKAASHTVLSRDGQPAVHPQPGCGLFDSSQRTRVVSACIRVLERISPAAGALMAHRELHRVPANGGRGWQDALWGEARMHRLPYMDGHVAAYQWGQGPTVLLAPGWGAHRHALAALIGPLVAAGYRVVACDAPGHGRSSGVGCDFALFAGAIASVGRQAGGLHAVIGHSFGAAMAMHAMRDWGMQAGKVVLIGCFDHLDWFMDAFATDLGISDDVLTRVRSIVVERSSGRHDWSRLSVVDMARGLASPLLVLHDRGDRHVPVSHAVAIASAAPGALLRITRGHGHAGVARSEEAASMLLQFLSS
jgi:pimeloyl-ACP methyl ester carboxylesterase